MAGIRVPIQTGRREPLPALGGSASTAARLANVVRRARQLSRQSVVCELRVSASRGIDRCAGPVAFEPISRRSAALHSRAGLRLSVHRLANASGRWGLLAARAGGDVSAGGVAPFF